MPLDWRTIPIKLSGGLDTKTDPKQVIPGRLTTLENGVYTAVDEVRKRNGYTGLSQSIIGGGTIATGQTLATLKNELVLADGNNVYSYAPGAAEWTPSRGHFIPASLTTQSISQENLTTVGTVDAAYHAGSGLKCITWLGVGGGVEYSILDTVTGARIVANKPLGSSISPLSPAKVLTLGNCFCIIYQGNSTVELCFAYINTATPTAISLDHVIAGTSDFDGSLAGGLFDACVLSSGADATVVWRSKTSTHSVGLRRLTASGGTVATGGAAVHLAATVSGALGCFRDASDRTWVGWYTGAATHGAVFDATTSYGTVLGDTVIDSTGSRTVALITGVVSGNTATFYYGHYNTGDYTQSVVFTNTLTTGGTVGSASVQVRGAVLTSKAFTYGGDTYALIEYVSSLQPTMFLLNFSKGNLIVGKLAPGLSGGLSVISGETIGPLLSEVAFTSATSFQVPYILIGEIQIENTVSESLVGASLAQITFSPPSLRTCELANGLLFAGASVKLYDGANLVEHGFDLIPEIKTAIPAGSGGSMSAGSYQFVAVYAWTDTSGQVHRSAPSVPVTVTCVNSDSVVITVSTLRVTQKTQVIVELYQTIANQTVFYRNYDTLNYNTTTADTVSFTTTTADSVILGQQQLYTTGGEVENAAPPASLSCTVFHNRAIMVSAEDPTSWWFSKQVLPGQPVEFSQSLVENIDQAGGGMTDVVVMDDKLVHLKNSGVFYTVGEGPFPNGANSDFSTVQLATDVGNKTTGSAVLTNDGIMFQSAKGLALLTRGLEVVYDFGTGAPVEAFNSQTVIASTLVPNNSQVRFIMSSGTCLVYDYFVRRWSTFTNHNAVSAVLWNAAYTFLDNVGLVHQETSGTYTDAGAFVKLKLVTSWLSLAGLQGFQRIRRLLLLGEWKGAHSLLVNLFYNFGATAEPHTLPALTSLVPYQFRVSPAQQKCETLQVSIEDSQSAAYNEGFSISGLMVEVGGKGGAFKTAATQNY